MRETIEISRTYAGGREWSVPLDNEAVLLAAIDALPETVRGRAGMTPSAASIISALDARGRG